MKLRLDTHVLLWALQQPRKLNMKVRRQIEDPKNEVFLSPISIWEANHLALRKKLRIPGSFDVWMREVFSRIPVREAPFNFQVASQVTAIDLPQADLGDLCLAATASVFELTLVTADEQLLGFKGLKTLAAN